MTGPPRHRGTYVLGSSRGRRFKPAGGEDSDVTTVSSAEHTRRDFLYIATGAVGAVGAAAALVPLIAQMNPDASTIAAGAPIEVDLAPIADGQIVKVFWRSKPIFIFHRTAKEIEEAKNVDVATLPDPRARRGARQARPRAVARRHRHLHPSRLHPARPSGRIRWLVLPVPRLAIRYRRPHSQRPGAEKPLPPAVQIRFRYQDSNRLSETSHSRFDHERKFDLPAAEQSSAMV